MAISRTDTERESVFYCLKKLFGGRKHMSNEIQVFKNAEFGSIRTIEINGDVWFVGKDIADVLGYSRPDHAIKKHVDEEDKLMYQIGTSGQNRQMYVINESGLYSLILSSKLPSAKDFKRWVTSDVLPTIRRNGDCSERRANKAKST